jgi:putative hydrolase of the HAD superfamily
MLHDAVLFDAADTLFTTRGSVGEIYGGVARGYGATASTAEIQEAFVRQFQHSGPLTTDNEKQWWKDVVRRVFLYVGMFENFDRFFSEVYELFGDSRGWMLFAETREVLEELKQLGLKLGVISNFDSRLYSVMQDLDIHSFFESITIFSETGYAKPQPEIFMAAVRSLAVPAGRILFAGDSLLDDFQAGQAAGLDAVLVDRSGRYAGMKSVRRIKSLLEIVPMVNAE